MRDEFADGLARARRRPRGAGHRAHRRGPRLPDRRRRHRDRVATASAWSATASRSRTGTCTSPSWHQHVWKPVITAVNGICAGGGFHWVADADIVIAASDAQFFDPHVSVGQVVSIEAIGLIRKMPAEAVMRMAFVGRYERMSAAAGLRARHDQPDRRSARAPARGGPGAGREDRPELAGGDGRDQAGAVGRARDWASPTPAGPARPSWSSMWGHPDQAEGPRAFAEKRDAAVAAARAGRDHGDGRGRRPREAWPTCCSTTTGRPRRRSIVSPPATITAPGASCGTRPRRWPTELAAPRRRVPASWSRVSLPSGPDVVGRPVRRLARRRRLRAAEPAPDRPPSATASSTEVCARPPCSTERRHRTGSAVRRDAMPSVRTPAAADLRRRRRADPVHVGDDRPAQGRCCCATRRARAARRRGGQPARDRRAAPVVRDATPMPNLIPVSLSLWAGIYNVLFAFRVGAPVVHPGPVHDPRVRRGGRATSASARRCCRPRP